MTKSEMNMVEVAMQRMWDEGYGAGIAGLYQTVKGARLEDLLKIHNKLRDEQIKVLIEAAGLKVDEK